MARSALHILNSSSIRIDKFVLKAEGVAIYPWLATRNTYRCVHLTCCVLPDGAAVLHDT